ncbi:MAG TPA: segregation/condensation protein A [Thermodesulfatator atlanticus]|uniref:Segregation and condensation protein A n=1 Tax=Thermodesulfatator atlanticus TaxID=501497 RepID=A0A7V5U3F5_9BACT|nr:segregation/condensation protein A [Thermodesulfatator atlanticus]
MSECIVKIPVFEGPLDLLLHLVRKNKLNIFDLPISLITEQYLAYLEMMKALDLEVAAEYLLMAATLLYLKSQLLLPKEEPPAQEEEDPRQEIVTSLLELAKFQQAAALLDARPVLDREVFVPPGEEPTPHEGLAVSLFDLLSALKEVLARRTITSLEVARARNLLAEKIPFILDQLKRKKYLYFRELLAQAQSREEVIALFLALLELAFRQKIRLIQPDPTSDIQVVRR